MRKELKIMLADRNGLQVDQLSRRIHGLQPYVHIEFEKVTIRQLG